jgi:SAM domain (Sterile alpha motif)
MSDALRHWLEGIRLEQHAETFLANDIDLDILPDLSDEDRPGTRVDPGVLARHIGGSPVCTRLAAGGGSLERTRL